MGNKKELTKNILKGILVAGGIMVAATDSKFAYKILPKLIKYAKYKLNDKKDKKKIYDTFYNLKRKNLIHFENRHGQVYISLTAEGKEKAGKYQIDDLEIKKPKKWDGKWRILIFDVLDKQKLKREALRGKIKELGLYQIQKSVWVYPYDFKNEMDLLRSFFNFSKGEMKIIVASEIEGEQQLKRYFKLI